MSALRRLAVRGENKVADLFSILQRGGAFSRRDFLRTAGTAAAAALALRWAVADGDGAAPRPNVLFIVSDDLNNALGCYGHSLVRTPNIDRLARRAVRFDRAYCQYPLCGPSRTSFLTGLRPGATGVGDQRNNFRSRKPDAVTLPQFFKKQGYFVARVGRIFHLGVPEDVIVGGAGPDDAISWDAAVNVTGPEHRTPGDSGNPTPQFDVEKNCSTAFHWIACQGEGEDQADYKIASEAIRLMEQKRDNPFFLGVGFVRPHVPLVAPKKYFDLYLLEKMELAQNPADDRADIPAATQKGRGKQADLGMGPQACREAIRGYYASISFMDAQVGRVLDALDRLGLADRTVVVFFGDNGYHLGEHQFWQKQTLFEESARVPLLVAAPGARAKGQASPGLVELVDLYPTLAELCGLPAPAGTDGQSFRRWLDEPGRPGKKAAFTEIWLDKVTGRSVRTERWRYTTWQSKEGPAEEELYDHEADPREYVNLARDARHASTVQELKELLKGVK